MPQLFTKQQSYSISYKVFHGITGIGVGVYIIVNGIDLARKLQACKPLAQVIQNTKTTHVYHSFIMSAVKSDP